MAQQSRPSNRSARGRQLIAGGVAAALVACGGELLAVAGFLGTGGGQFYVDANPDSPGFQSCTAPNCQGSISLSIDPVEIVTGTPDLYATSYPVRVLSVENALPNCRGTSGSVEGRRVVIGTNGACFSGQYVTVNQIVSDDGRTVLFKDFFPSMTAGTWVDVNDSARRFKFTSNTAGCEIRGTERRSFTDAQLVTSNLGEIVLDPNTANRRDRTFYSSLTVAGGETWTGEFIGISGLRLTSGDRSIDLQRRNEPATCT